jgi:sugar lactone lactonase YvrE
MRSTLALRFILRRIHAKSLLCLMLLPIGSLASAQAKQQAQPSRPVKVLRYYDAAAKRYVLTSDDEGEAKLPASFQRESTVEGTPDSPFFYLATTRYPGTVPLYRFRGAGGSQRFVRSLAERAAVKLKGLEEIAKPVFVYSEPVEGASEIFDLTNAENGDHLYTTSLAEMQYLTGLGWNKERSLGYTQATSSSGTGILWPKTVKLEDADLALLAKPAGDGSKLVFGSTNAKLAKLVVGANLYVPVKIGRDAKGNLLVRRGLMRQVTSIVKKGAGLEIATSQAKYKDLFHDVHLFIDSRPAVAVQENSVTKGGEPPIAVAADAPSATASQTATGVKGKSFDNLTDYHEPEYLSLVDRAAPQDAVGANLSFSVNVNGTLSPDGVSLVTLNGGVSAGLTGEINFGAGCSDSIDLLFTSICDQFTASGTVLFTPQASANITASVDAVSGISIEEKVFEQVQMFSVGEIPVSVTEDLFLGASITDQATAVFSASASAQGTGGFSASLVVPEVWDSSGSVIGCPDPCPPGFSCGGSGTGPTCTVSASAGDTINLNPGNVDVQVWVRPQISAGPGIDDLTATVNFSLKNALDFNFSSSAITGTYEVTPSVGYQAGLCIWGVNIGESDSTDLAEIDVPIFGGGSPTVTTSLPTSISQIGTLIEGQVTPTDLLTLAHFSYGTDPTLAGAAQTGTQDCVKAPCTLNAMLTGLTPNTQYYYQIVAQNLLGTTNGAIMSFHEPSVQTINFPNPGMQTYGAAPMVLKAVATSGLPVTYTVISGPATVVGNTLTVTGSGSITVEADQAGNVNFFPAPSVTVTFLVMPEAQGFGAVVIGQTSPTLTLSFTFAPGTTFAEFQALTEGAYGKDFTVTNTVSNGTTVKASVTFKPLAPGTRSGAVVAYDIQGNVMATAMVSGVGIGPQITFYANKPTTTLQKGFMGSSGAISPTGLVVDGNGNLFVASYPLSPQFGAGTVTEISTSGTSSTLAAQGSNFLSPAAVAIDGAGNLYAVDQRRSQLVQLIAPGYATAVVLQPTYGNGTSSISRPKGIAADGKSNLFIADTGNNVVWEVSASGNYQTATQVASGLSSPSGLAIDSNGNLFVADTGNNQVKEFKAPGYTSVQILGSGFSAPVSLAVDAAGDVYVADTGHNAVKEILAAGGYTTVQTLGSGFSSPNGVAVDAAGNVYVADSGNGAVKKLDLSDAPKESFAATSINASSSDSPWTVIVANNGNEPLIFPYNPILPTGFPLVSASTCPELSASGSPAVLAPGANCNFMVSFTPTDPGPTTGTLVLTDNHLNAAAPAYVSQSIQFSGTGLFPAVLTASVTPAENKTYDGTTVATVTGCSLTGVLPSDVGFVTCSVTSASFSSPSAGVGKPVSAVIALSGAASGHYVLSSPTVMTAASITPGTLTVTANNLLIPIGATVPAVTFAYSGFVNGEGPSVVKTAPTCSTTAKANSIQGNYPIVCTGGVAPNYNFLYQNGTLTVSLGAQFVTTEYSLGTGFSSANGVAVDGNGNVYVADTGHNAVRQYLMGNSYAMVTLGSGFSSPGGLAVDASGNVYVADTGNNAVKQILAAGGYKTIQTLGSGFRSPEALAVDVNGNVFVADTGNNAVKEILAAGGYVTVKTLGQGFSKPSGIGLDGSGDVFVADQGNNAIKEIVPLGGYRKVTTLGSGFTAPYGLAVDNNWNLYITDTGSGAVKELMAPTYSQITTLSGGFSQGRGLAVDKSGNVYVVATGTTPVKVIAYAPCFPTTPVGGTSLKFSYSFAFLVGGSIASPAVLTQGSSKQDYVDAGTGSCTTNGASHVYKPGDSCTVDVIFTPKHAGPRLGSVQLTNTSGALVATALVSGAGMAPQVVFSSNTSQKMLGSGFQSANAVAIDGTGNVFVADTKNNAVKEILAAGGYTTVKTLGSGFSSPSAIAVDGDGNVFVADAGNKAVKEIVSVGGYKMVNTLGGNFMHPSGVALDGAGNVFVADSGNSTVYEILWGGLVTELSSSFSSPSGIAVDNNSNVFVADTGNNAVKEILANGGYATVNTLGSGFSAPTGVTVEASGNVLVADTKNNALKEIVAAGGYTTVNTIKSGLNSPTGVVLDQSGNAFLSLAGSHVAVELPLATAPALAFASTTVGQTSAAMTVTVENNGNAALLPLFVGTSTVPATSKGFAVTGGSCVQLIVKGSPWLGPGASCTFNVAFAPQTGQTGKISGTLTLTDNGLNANPMTQSIALSGTAVAAAVVHSWTYDTSPSAKPGTDQSPIAKKATEINR